MSKIVFSKELVLEARDLVPTGACFAPNDAFPGQLFYTDQFRGLYRTEGGAEFAVMDMKDGIERLVQESPKKGAFADERGVLSVAFHPRFGIRSDPDNRTLFLFYSRSKADEQRLRLSQPVLPRDQGQGQGLQLDHFSVLSKFTVEGGIGGPSVLPDSEVPILVVPQYHFNHNGGGMAFGPDGLLYLGMGDGGGQRDQHGPLLDASDKDSYLGWAQDVTQLEGKILRLNVDGASAERPYTVPPGNPFVNPTLSLPATARVDGSVVVAQAGRQVAPRQEIWAYGLRNPWKLSFNEAGKLIIADVGQDDIEEINIGEAGANYGWRAKEGTAVFNRVTHDTLASDGRVFTDPKFQYEHGAPHNRRAIIGGYTVQVSRHRKRHVFGDYNGEVMVAAGKGVRSIFRFPTESIHGFAASGDHTRLFVLTRTHFWRRDLEGAGRVWELFVRERQPAALDSSDVARLLATGVAAAQTTPSSVRLAGATTRMHLAVYIPHDLQWGAGSYEVRSMADAWDGSLDIARAKAYSGFAFSSSHNRLTSGDIGRLSQPGQPLWNIGNVSKSGKEIIEFPGGVPLYKDGALVGGVGVSGDGVDEDERVAMAMAAAL